MRAERGSSAADRVRYGQCWEDAGVLLEALDVRAEHVCVSIASAGDNTLSLLSRGPRRVIAVDLSPAQLACLELRVAGFRRLGHRELLELIGSRPSDRRGSLYARCRDLLSDPARRFWDARPRAVTAGIGAVGRFERYLALFRRVVLPLVHGRARVDALLAARPDPDARRHFHETEWDTWRWRLAFRIFFSRAVMARLGRDPDCFRYADGRVADRILARSRHALTALEPARNPYLHWILTGRHGAALPHALDEAQFETIRANLDRLEWHAGSLAAFLESRLALRVDRWNLSDIFEYLAPEAYERHLERIVAASRPAARLAYWNLLAPRRRPPRLAERLRPLDALAERLHREDRAFFYDAFVLEEVTA